MKIWLSIALNTFGFVFLFITLAMPIGTNAGVFSFIGQIISGNEAEAAPLRQVSVQNMSLLQAPINSNLLAGTGGGDITIVDNSALMAESGVAGTLADIQNEQPTQISLYVVRQGDSLSQIAKMFGVSVNTIIWANDIKGTIREGDKLIILPISGVSYTVLKGDTLRSIALKFKGDVSEIMKYNDLAVDQSLVVGSIIVIPDGEIKTVNTSSSKPTSGIRGAGGPNYSGYYIRPIDIGRRTQGLHGNNGVDFGGVAIGTPIHASADGVVIIAKAGGWNGGYGSYVVISHANNTQTLYAHASMVFVRQGDTVRQGDIIAALGNTGKSTGPHVHFEVRGAQNPFK
jgi:LysM repeat protein